MTANAWGPPYSPPVQPKRRGLAPLLIGLATLFFGVPLAFLLPLLLGIGPAAGQVLSGDAVPAGQTVALEGATEEIMLVLPGDQGPGGPIECRVTDPTGSAVPVSELGSEEAQRLSDSGEAPPVDGLDTSGGLLWRFTTGPAGDYRIDCGEGSTARVFSGGDVDDIAGRVGTSLLISLVLSGLTLALGLGLTIWGIVQLVRTGRAQAGLAYGGAAPYPPAPGHGPYDQAPPPVPSAQAPYGQAPPPPPTFRPGGLGDDGEIRDSGPTDHSGSGGSTRIGG